MVQSNGQSDSDGFKLDLFGRRIVFAGPYKFASGRWLLRGGEEELITDNFC